MSIKTCIGYLFAKYIVKKNNRWKHNAVSAQNKLMLQLIAQAKNTKFGKDHRFNKIKNYTDWKKNIPIRDYEDLKNYIEDVIRGEENVLWPGKPIYFCKTGWSRSYYSHYFFVDCF